MPQAWPPLGVLGGQGRQAGESRGPRASPTPSLRAAAMAELPARSPGAGGGSRHESTRDMPHGTNVFPSQLCRKQSGLSTATGDRGSGGCPGPTRVHGRPGDRAAQECKPVGGAHEIGRRKGAWTVGDLGPAPNRRRAAGACLPPRDGHAWVVTLRKGAACAGDGRVSPWAIVPIKVLPSRSRPKTASTRCWGSNPPRASRFPLPCGGSLRRSFARRGAPMPAARGRLRPDRCGHIQPE